MTSTEGARPRRSGLDREAHRSRSRPRRCGRRGIRPGAKSVVATAADTFQRLLRGDVGRSVAIARHVGYDAGGGSTHRPKPQRSSCRVGAIQFSISRSHTCHAPIVILTPGLVVEGRGTDQPNRLCENASWLQVAGVREHERYIRARVTEADEPGSIRLTRDTQRHSERDCSFRPGLRNTSR